MPIIFHSFPFHPLSYLVGFLLRHAGKLSYLVGFFFSGTPGDFPTW